MSAHGPALSGTSSASPSKEEEALLLQLQLEARGAPLVKCTLPAKAVDVAPLLALADTAFLWAPDETTAWVGLDTARVYEAKGERRFEVVKDSVTRDTQAACITQVPEAAPQALRVFGGFSFVPGHSDDAWSCFGDARFLLPRFSYERHFAKATLALTLTQEELENRELALRWIRRASKLQHRLERCALPPTSRGEPVTVSEVTREQWAEVVSSVLSALESGIASKIVVARRIGYEFARPISLCGTLQALMESASGSARFALKLKHQSFVGATPERLIQKQGLCLETEALAGTFRTAPSVFAEELLRSPKEHSEHAPVLEAIVERLRPLCASISHPDNPELRELPDLLHLQTPIRAVLRTPVHVVDLVERLHPTPAVGGVPSDVAVRWIADHEPVSRGWYSGPVGFFDANGDGEFYVALRAGLIQEHRAYLYAGGGIVRGSEPASEYAETELKLKALRGSLRLE